MRWKAKQTARLVIFIHRLELLKAHICVSVEILEYIPVCYKYSQGYGKPCYRRVLDHFSLPHRQTASGTQYFLVLAPLCKHLHKTFASKMSNPNNCYKLSWLIWKSYNTCYFMLIIFWTCTTSFTDTNLGKRF